MTQRFWIHLSLGLLCVSLVAFSYVIRKPLCIDSNLVEKFDRITEANSFSVYRCGLMKSVGFHQKFSNELAGISARLQKLEKLLDSIGPLENRVHVHILEQKDRVFRVVDHNIFLSENLYLTKGILEKAILKIWYREKANPMIWSQSLFEETWTDLIYANISGNSINESIQKTPWPHLLQTYQGYCASPWVSLEHINFCERFKELKNPIEDRLAFGSLRPMLTSALIQFFNKQPGSVRWNILKSLAGGLKSIELFDYSSAFQPSDINLTEFYDIRQILQSWLQNSKNLFQKVNAQFPEELGLELAEFQYDFEKPFVFDLGIEQTQEDIDKTLKPILNDLFKRKKLLVKKTIAMIGPSKILVLPNEYGLPKQKLDGIKYFRKITFSCVFPSQEEVLRDNPDTERVLWIRNCANDELNNIQLRSLIENGIFAFSEANPQVSFIEFHVGSLLLSKESGVNLIDEIKKGYRANKTYLEKPKSYKLNIPVDGITLFRIL